MSQIGTADKTLRRPTRMVSDNQFCQAISDNCSGNEVSSEKTLAADRADVLNMVVLVQSNFLHVSDTQLGLLRSIMMCRYGSYVKWRQGRHLAHHTSRSGLSEGLLYTVGGRRPRLPLLTTHSFTVGQNPSAVLPMSIIGKTTKGFALPVAGAHPSPNPEDVVERCICDTACPWVLVLDR